MNKKSLPIHIEFEFNGHGQPVGICVNDFVPAKWPQKEIIEGKYCTLIKLDANRHAQALYDASQLDPHGVL